MRFHITQREALNDYDIQKHNDATVRGKTAQSRNVRVRLKSQLRVPSSEGCGIAGENEIRAFECFQNFRGLLATVQLNRKGPHNGSVEITIL